MGLDMYLEKFPSMGLEPRTFNAVNAFVRWVNGGREYSFSEYSGYNERNLPDTATLVKLLGMLRQTYYAWDVDKRFPQDSISEQVGYWRKANAIHKWFVENVQDGEDDCDYHRTVTKNDVETLFELCREVLADHTKACKLLPVESGFFFGSQLYDEWYFKSIEYTAELCERLINDFDFENYDLYYLSSW